MADDKIRWAPRLKPAPPVAPPAGGDPFLAGQIFADRLMHYESDGEWWVLIELHGQPSQTFGPFRTERDAAARKIAELRAIVARAERA